jgi:signal transduction histidine kinase/CheY-like chemotaxis protein
MFGHEANWDDIPTAVITGVNARDAASHFSRDWLAQRFPDFLASKVISHKGRRLALGSIDIADVRQRKVGELLLAHDTTAVFNHFWLTVGCVVIGSSVVTGVLLYAFYSLLTRIDRELTTAGRLLHRTKRRAEDSSRAKSDFLANMSHEIRTPMTSIIGFSDVLLDPSISGDEKLKAVRIVRRNGQHLLQVINDILDISKIEAGSMEVEQVPCSAIQVVAEVQSMMTVKAKNAGLEFHVEFKGKMPETIVTDPTRLRQILINLVGNAIKFTNSGFVHLIASTIELDDKPKRLQFDVIDTGEGLDQDQIGRLFRPFTQANNSVAREFGGTGLGLTISRRFAKMLGGNVTVESTPGVGSRFCVTIDPGPLDDVRMIRSPSTASIDNQQDDAHHEVSSNLPTGCRILLAEDGPDNQRLISFLLKRAGATVTVASNGQIAVEQVAAANDRHEPFDMVLMDMQMPVLDGYSATRQLRSLGHIGPIIALTAHALKTDRQKCIDSGCNDYETKPIDRNRLIVTILRNIAPASTSLSASSLTDVSNGTDKT